MNKFKAKRAGLKRRERRVRSKICGTAERPRLSVHRTNTNIYAQVIDDIDALWASWAPTRRPPSSWARWSASAPSRLASPR